jgi:hypothetical protein
LKEAPCAKGRSHASEKLEEALREESRSVWWRSKEKIKEEERPKPQAAS